MENNDSNSWLVPTGSEARPANKDSRGYSGFTILNPAAFPLVMFVCVCVSLMMCVLQGGCCSHWEHSEGPKDVGVWRRRHLV